MIRKKKKDEEEWDLSNLPPNWTVDDIEARAPQHIKDIKQFHRLLLDMPKDTDGYQPEFFLMMTYDERMSAKARLQKLVDSGKLKSFTMKTEAPGRADFIDAIIKTVEAK
jgi:hypothetical protein